MNHFFISGVVLCCVVLCCVHPVCLLFVSPGGARATHGWTACLLLPLFSRTVSSIAAQVNTHTVVHKGLQIGLPFDESSSGGTIHIW